MIGEGLFSISSKADYEKAVKLANEASEAYYDGDTPIMEDPEFDKLMQEIQRFEDSHPGDVASDSPTKRVGGSQGSGSREKVVHGVPMLSLRNVFSSAEIEDFEASCLWHGDFVVEPKIDGLSVSFTYVKGKFVRAETRGDGLVGEDITENARCIKGIPDELPEISGNTTPDLLEVRGEVYLPVERFLALNKEREKEGKKLFANPRNAASGLLRTKDVSITKDAGLECLIFNVQRCVHIASNAEKFGNSHWASLIAMEQCGFPVVPCLKVRDAKAALAAVEHLQSQRDSFPYWIDGAVIKLDNLKRREEMGSTDKYPKWAVAYKYPPEEKETEIIDILLQTGRTGRVTPVAVLAPVILGGTTVQRVTLNNPEFIEKLGVDVGDTVLIRKAAEIIPEIIKVTKKCDGWVNAAFDVFDCVCPSCGGKLVPGTDEYGNNASGAYCTNNECPAQFARYVEFFGSKDCMDIRGLGPSVVDRLIESELIRDVVDLYTLYDIPEVVESILGQKTAQNLFAAIEESKRRPLGILIKALGIEGVGRHIGDALADTYGSIFELEGRTDENDFVDELMKIEGIGAKSAWAISDYFRKTENWERLYALHNLGVNTKATKKAQPAQKGSLLGRTFVVTGIMTHGTRADIHDFIRRHGGIPADSITKNTDYLVCGAKVGSTKINKAAKYGVKTITEQELYAMCNGAK